MPSFVCDVCQETLKKAKLDAHTMRCRNAIFSCIDCYTTFKGTDYRAHTACITEVQKYHKKPAAAPAIVPSATPVATPSKIPTESAILASCRRILKRESRPVTLKALKKLLKQGKNERKDRRRLLNDNLVFSLDEAGHIVAKFVV